MKKLINFYQRLSFMQGCAFALSILSVIGLSAHTLTPFHIFTPNSVISSSKVNENFNTLATAIESMSSTETYKGTWDANNAFPTATMTGDYFLVSIANGAYAVGDKIIVEVFQVINGEIILCN